jgi:uncharacterized protein (DUF1800 family)
LAAAAVAGGGVAAGLLLDSRRDTAGAADAAGAQFVAADPLLHLLRRATWGPTPASSAEIRRLGATAWLDRQLAPAQIADPTCDGLLARLPLAHLTITEARARMRAGAVKEFGWDIGLQVGFAAIARAIWSERQLLEVMVDFWSNHLNVTCPLDAVWDSRQDYDRTVIRAHALGRFADLLKASARHPAMLTYLDSRSSMKSAPNENYGRELLELHSVGLVHTEADVAAAARLLTGLTVDPSTATYRYDAARHATGAVRILEFSHPNTTASGGEAAALALLEYLALHPATAERIARKLCVRFVADDPPPTLVTTLAQVYLANGSAIAPVLRTLFGSAEFAAAAGAKTRTPLEDFVATVRVLGYGPEAVTGTNPTGTKGLEALYWRLWAAGQAPLAWGPPNGYPDVAAAWASPSGHLIRWNAHLEIAAGWWPDVLVRPTNLVAAMIGSAPPATYGALMDAIAIRLVGRTLVPAHTEALAKFCGKTAASPLKAGDAAVTWMFPWLLGLVLNSPYFATR